MDGRNDLVSPGNGKRATGTEVILDIGDDENVVRIDLHVRLLRRKSLAQGRFLERPPFTSGNGFHYRVSQRFDQRLQLGVLPPPLPELLSYGLAAAQWDSDGNGTGTS